MLQSANVFGSPDIFYRIISERLTLRSDYTLEERLMFRPIAYANAIQAMSVLLHAVEKLGKLPKNQI